MGKLVKTLASGTFKEYGYLPKKTRNWGAKCEAVIPELRRPRQGDEFRDGQRDSGNSQVSPVLPGENWEVGRQRERETETDERLRQREERVRRQAQINIK